MPEDTKTHKILVVDDDQAIIKLVGTILKSKGYDVLSATEAPLGLEMAMNEKPDLLILDVMMPIINGFNICRLMKSENDCQHIPIVMLTSRDEEEDRKIGKEVGANAYISKPFKTEELLSTVEDLLNQN